MPRADTTPTRRKKRDTQTRTSQGLARTAASVRAAAMANINAGGSISAPIVKREPVPTPMPAAPTKKTAVSSPPRNWRHPDELAYIRNPGKTWNDMAIVRFIAANAFSVPPRGTHSMEPWVQVRCANGTDIVLPRGYRLPLLWVAKYQWKSVQLVLTAEQRQTEWDGAKFEILHIARLCAGLLARAKAQWDENGVMERGWRCAQFDRALHRYWHDWLIMRDEFVRDFFREFGEEEYQIDVLKFTWSRWVLKGHKGFTLTAGESADGITAEQFMHGLVINEATNTFEWRAFDTPEETSEIPTDATATPQTQENKNLAVAPPVATTAVKTPIPSDGVPRNAYRTSARQSSKKAKTSFARSRAKGETGVDDFAANSATQDARPASTQPQTHSPVDESIPLPGELPGESTPIESRGVSSDADRNMEVDEDVPPRKTEGVVRTAMGSLRPGSSGLRGRSMDAGPSRHPGEQPNVALPEHNDDHEMQDVLQQSEKNTTDGRAGSPGIALDMEKAKAVSTSGQSSRVLERQEWYEGTSDEDSGDDEMRDEPQRQETGQDDAEDIVTDDLGLDGDLELLYPDQDSAVPHAAEDQTPSPSLSSASRSRSGSGSPIPPLSSARFPAAAATASTQLAIYPHGGQELGALDPGLATRFLQSWEILGDDLRALRAEVAQLRAAHVAPHAELEARVRLLEERASPAAAHPPGRSGQGGHGRWVHPLQHLISRGNAEMEDDPVSPQPHDMNIMTTYGSVDGGEPLPPRSRKFNHTPRFSGS
ncbi:hypothetical protein DFH06DRAFT_1122101 [Mycena polygramma]|nr:hypothetical protein DFH06DRAFT_1122101 [Mycena polygramma]